MTKKRTKYRLRPIDLYVTLVCLGVCVLFLCLFWKDLNKSSVRNDKAQIATVTFKHRVAQRKYSDRVVWERVQEEAPLYNLDTIRTADLADATIKFIDGTILELHENTMLQIAYGETGVKLSVGGGDVIVDTSKSEKQVEVKMDNGTAVNLAAGSKLAAKSDGQSGEANFQIQAGSGSVLAEDGTKQIVETGETVKVASSGQVKKGGITVTSISSDVKVLNFEEEAQPVHLEWKATEDMADAKIVVETSKTKDFSKVEKTFTSEGSSSIDLPADAGTMYWRVYAKEYDEEPVSGKIKVENIENIVTSAPVDGAVFKYRDELPQLRFVWTGNDYVDHYKVQISETKDFTKAIFDQEVGVTSLSLAQLAEGKYYWRVIPYYAVNNLGYGENSEVKSFIIERKREITPPILSVPVENAKLVYVNKDLATAFMWKSEIKEADYTLLVAKDSNFENIVLQKDTKKSRYQATMNISDMGEGQYYWKVIRKSEEEENPVESQSRSFTLSKYVPAKNRLIYPPENFSVEDAKLKNVDFQWKLGDSYKNQESEHILQFSKSKSFEESIEFKTTLTDMKNIQIPETGKYFWRVGVMDFVTNEYVFTDARAITVLSELKTPSIVYPKTDSILVIQKETPVKVSWNAVEGADYYKVRLLNQDGNVVSEVNDIRGTKAEVKIPKAGNKLTAYKITVQALAEETEYSALRVSKYRVVNVKVRQPAPVLLGTPVNNRQISGLSAIREPIALTWVAQEDKPDYSQLILRKVQATGSSKIVQTIDNPGKTVYFDRLSAGTYLWTVKAGTNSGLNLDAESYNRFVISDIPELARPVLSEPKENFVVGPEYLKKNRNISFEWESVPSATDYMFVLYRRTSDGLQKIYSEKLEKNTSVKIKDLKIFDVGEYEWQVTAYTHAKDGFEEQHSKAAIGHFSIEFKKPKKIQIKDPGKLYAK